MINTNENGDVEILGEASVVLVEFAGVTKAIYSSLKEYYPAASAKTTILRIVEHSMEVVQKVDFDYDSSLRIINDIMDLLKPQEGGEF